jgi:hypothetical protein
MKVYPVKCECYDEQMQSLIFTIEAFDECCAQIEIKTVFNGDSWAEISEKVAEALELMDMGKAKE